VERLRDIDTASSQVTYPLLTTSAGVPTFYREIARYPAIFLIDREGRLQPAPGQGQGENLVLRQQLAVLKRRHPRPSLGLFDKLFWVVVRRFWSEWRQALIIVTPETVVRWHRTGFRLYWRLISRVRKQVGRRGTPKEVRELIFRIVVENPTWGAPRIHGELLMIGFDLSERTVSRWMKRAPRGPDRAKRWLAFLRNHREAIAAMDFFTVPTITFGVFYCFFVIRHDRWRILHVNVSKHPTSVWVVQQLREAFPFELAPQFLIFDRDAKYGLEVPMAVRSLKMSPVRTCFESPWQNGVAERWVESCPEICSFT
jgi:putative transposase